MTDSLFELACEALSDGLRNAHPGVGNETLLDPFGLEPAHGLVFDVVAVTPDAFVFEMARESRAKRKSDFLENLYRQAPWFREFDLGAAGLVIAGSSAALSLLYQRPEYGDIDLFYVGGSEGGASAALAAIVEFLRRQPPPIVVTESAGAVTFRVSPSRDHERPPLTIQLIRRVYSSVAEVLHGFDLGASAVAYDGARLWTTRLGALALTHGFNVVNLKARRARYERRLRKYFVKYGFGIVYPFAGAAVTRGRCFPGLGHVDVEEHRSVNHLVLYRNLEEPVAADAADADAPSTYADCDLSTAAEVAQYNLAALTRGAPPRALQALPVDVREYGGGDGPVPALSFEAVRAVVGKFVADGKRRQFGGCVRYFGADPGTRLLRMCWGVEPAEPADLDAFAREALARHGAPTVERAWGGCVADTLLEQGSLLSAEHTDAREWYGAWYSEYAARRFQLRVELGFGPPYEGCGLAENKEACPVCHERDQPQAELTGCNHQLCVGCLERVGKKCPLCRAPFR